MILNDAFSAKQDFLRGNWTKNAAKILQIQVIKNVDVKTLIEHDVDDNGKSQSFWWPICKH